MQHSEFLVIRWYTRLVLHFQGCREHEVFDDRCDPVKNWFIFKWNIRNKKPIEKEMYYLCVIRIRKGI